MRSDKNLNSNRSENRRRMVGGASGESWRKKDEKCARWDGSGSGSESLDWNIGERVKKLGRCPSETILYSWNNYTN